MLRRSLIIILIASFCFAFLSACDNGKEKEIAAMREQQKQEEMKAKLSQVLNDLQEKMRENAWNVARQAHPLSEIEACTPEDMDDDYQKSKTSLDMVATFECHTKGAVLSYIKYRVGVKVRGRIELVAGNWESKIIESWKVYDKEK